VEPGKKIVCVEDDRETASLIAEHLTEWGFEPVVAHSGHEGFAEIIKQRPDLVLCDINLPTSRTCPASTCSSGSMKSLRSSGTFRSCS
jgi:DNA-binding response OmpR family regulator